MNYYNEFDFHAVAWLRELIAAKLIPDGEVDARSITDVSPNDLKPFTQCHFFAGIAGWPLALALAGVDSTRPLWTGSCPCQPFSVAGKGLGTADERHLWPVFANLIRECRPPTVFGEQVASRAGRGWLARVFADLEGMGYAVAGADLCAAGVGAPHIRQRLYWVADTDRGRCQQRSTAQWPVSVANESVPDGWQRVSFAADCEGYDEETGELGDICSVCGLDYCDECQCPGPTQDEYEYGEWNGILYARRLVHPIEPGLQGHAGNGNDGDQPGRELTDTARPIAPASGACGLGHADGTYGEQLRGHAGQATKQSIQRVEDPWSEADWLPCLDGKTRRIESGTFPLAHGVPGRVGLLRGYGNAIVPQVAAAFVKAAMNQ